MHSFRFATGSPWTIGAGSDVNQDTNNVDRPTINGVHQECNGERQPDFMSLDLRLGKVFRFGRTRSVVSLDIFNALNSDAVVTVNQAFASWITMPRPSEVLNPRLMKISWNLEF